MFAVGVQGDNCSVVEAHCFDVEAFGVLPADAESQDADCSPHLGLWKAAISGAGVAEPRYVIGTPLVKIQTSHLGCEAILVVGRRMMKRLRSEIFCAVPQSSKDISK